MAYSSILFYCLESNNDIITLLYWTVNVYLLKCFFCRLIFMTFWLWKASIRWMKAMIVNVLQFPTCFSLSHSLLQYFLPSSPSLVGLHPRQQSVTSCQVALTVSTHISTFQSAVSTSLRVKCWILKEQQTDSLNVLAYADGGQDPGLVIHTRIQANQWI